MNTNPTDQAATTAPRTTTGTTAPAVRFTCPAVTDGTTAPNRRDQKEVQDVPTVGQRAGRLRAQGLRARAANPDAAAGRVRTFLPGDASVDPYLSLVRSLALTAVPVNAEDAAELLTALASHAAHLVATGTPVDQDTLLDPARVDAWLLRGAPALGYGTSANYRSRLLRVAQALTGVPDGTTPMPSSDPATVYRPAEEDRLVSWAVGLANERQRADVCAALGVLLGTGSTAAEVMGVRSHDLGVLSGGGVTLCLGSRTVPVRERYRHLVVRAARRADGDGGFLVMPDAPGRGGRNGLSNLVDRALDGHTGVPRLTPQRTRATWVVRQMEAATRADVLVAAAGVTSFAALARYVGQMYASTAADVQGLRLLGEQK